MKERFALGRRPHIEPQSTQERAFVLGRVYRGVGRLCLMAAAVCGSVDALNSAQGSVLPYVTLRSLLDLSPQFDGSGFAHIRAAAELAVNLPLWVVLVVAAAIPYALAVERFIRSPR